MIELMRTNDEVFAVVVKVVRDALSKTGGNQCAAAALLGINRNTLHRYLKEMGIEYRQFKPSRKASRGSKSWERKHSGLA